MNRIIRIRKKIARSVAYLTSGFFDPVDPVNPI